MVVVILVVEVVGSGGSDSRSGGRGDCSGGGGNGSGGGRSSASGGCSGGADGNGTVLEVALVVKVGMMVVVVW